MGSDLKIFETTNDDVHPTGTFFDTVNCQKIQILKEETRVWFVFLSFLYDKSIDNDQIKF